MQLPLSSEAIGGPHSKCSADLFRLYQNVLLIIPRVHVCLFYALSFSLYSAKLLFTIYKQIKTSKGFMELVTNGKIIAGVSP